MGVEDSAFKPYAEGKELTAGQAEVIKAILALEKEEFVGKRGDKICLKEYPGVEITVGNDGLKFIVVSADLGIFAKVYWEAEYAEFVGETYREIAKYLWGDEKAVETQTVLGTMGRALIFKFQDGLIPVKDDDKELGRAIKGEIEGKLRESGKNSLAKLIAIPTLLRSGNGTLISDYVIDDNYLLVKFCSERDRYLD